MVEPLEAKQLLDVLGMWVVEHVRRSMDVSTLATNSSLKLVKFNSVR